MHMTQMIDATYSQKLYDKEETEEMRGVSAMNHIQRSILHVIFTEDSIFLNLDIF